MPPVRLDPSPINASCLFREAVADVSQACNDDTEGTAVSALGGGMSHDVTCSFLQAHTHTHTVARLHECEHVSQ